MNEAKAIADLLDGFFNGIRTQEKLNAIGLSITRTIKTRTRSWRDVDGKRFQDYSEAYKKKRVAAGLSVSPRGKDTDSMLVWNSTDGMMQQIREIVSKELKGVVVDIASAEKKKLMYYHSEAGVGKAGKNIRKAWGLSIEECNLIAKKFTIDAGQVLGDLVKLAQLKVD
jgi:hypothetical protein